MVGSSCRLVLGALVITGSALAFDANAAVLIRKDAAVPFSTMGEGVIRPDDGVRISVSGNGGASFLSVGVGIFSLEAAPSSPPPTDSDFAKLITFCLEINQALTWTEAVHTYEMDTLPTADDRDLRIGRLWESFFDDVLDDLPTDRGIRAAAFQTAIWEIMEDAGGTLDVTAGNFRIDCTIGDGAAVCAAATAFLATVDSGTPDTTLIRLTSPTQQDLISFIGGPGSGGLPDPTADVPVPASLLLLGSALAGLGLRRRRD